MWLTQSSKCSDCRNIHHILWNQTAHYRVRKCPPLLPALNQMNTAHTLSSYFFFRSILSRFTTRFYEWSLSFRICEYRLVRTPNTSHLLDFDPSFGKELKLRSSSLCRFESKTSEIAVSWVATPHGLVDKYQRFRGTTCRHNVDRWSIDPDNGSNRRLAESWILFVRSAKFLGIQGPILKLRLLFHIVLAITVELCKIVAEIIVLCCMSNAKKCLVVEVVFVIVFSREDVESDLLCLPF